MWRTLFVLFLLTPPAPAAQPANRAADEAAIRSVVRSYVDARDVRDSAAIEAIFTADADQHTTAGEWRRGRAEVIRGSLQSSARNPGKRSITVETIRFITADVAIADGPYEIANEGAVRRMWTTIVLERAKDAWRIAAIRNMMPVSQGARGPAPARSRPTPRRPAED